jgi:hypothetical protein
MIEILKQALEALKDVGVLTDREWQAVHKNKANELRKAIAELESQEPVAVVDANDDGYWADILPNRNVKVGQFLYTQPPQRTEQDWDALAEKQLASIKRDTKATTEGAVVRATHKVMAQFEIQPKQELPCYSFKAYWETDGRIGVVACIERPDGGVHLMSEILDLPPSTEPQHTPEHQARIAAFKDAMHTAKEKNNA